MRILLLHILNEDRYQIQRDQCFPFINALLSNEGVQTRRLFIGVRSADRCGEERLVFQLPGTDTDALVEEIRRWSPTHVLLNERLDEPSFQRLADAVGSRSRFLYVANSWWSMRQDLLMRLKLPEALLGSPTTPIERMIPPDCSGEPLNEAATRVRPFTWLLLGRTCSYKPSIRSNPFFEDLQLGEMEGHRGCSFCSSWREEGGNPPSSELVPLAMSQIEASLATLNPDVQDREFLIRGTTIIEQMDRLAMELETKELPPCVFYLTCRVDEILRAAPQLRRALPVLERRGHRLVLWNIGIENFSPQENLRFNKGLDTETIGAGLAEIGRLKTSHPASFEAPRFGFILFTPWTTFEDLRTNVRVARELGQIEPFWNICLGTALQLLPDRPITKLAVADGLASPAFGDCALDSGCITSWNDTEIPWRFQDPDVSRVFFVARRFGPHRDVPADDEDVPLVQAFRERALKLGVSQIDPLVIFEAVLDAVESAPERSDPAQLLGRVWDILVAREAARRRSLPCEPDPDEAPLEAASPQDSDPWAAFAKTLARRLRESPAELASLGVEVLRIDSRIESGAPSLLVKICREGRMLEVVIEPQHPERRYFESRDNLGIFYRSRDLPVDDQEISAMRSILGAAAATARP